MNQDRTVLEDDADVSREHSTSGELAVEKDVLAVGGRLGPYRLRARIGEGGMGVVYAATDSRLRREVALKVLWPGLTTRAHRVDRMRREARAMAKLSHPNVVQVFDVGEHAGQIYLAMELVDGVNLEQWLGLRPRAVDEILAVFLEAGKGLAAAHAADLVHRDFKPSNVLVAGDGRVKVGDFGLVRTMSDPTTGTARAAERAIAADTGAGDPLRTRGIVGTPRYMAPEQHDGADVDARADQYAFCMALLEALRGDSPLHEADLQSLSLAKHMGFQHALPASLPTWLARALERGLSPRAADRFESMSALLTALTPARRHALTWIGIGMVIVSVAGTIAVLTAPARECDGPWTDLTAQWPGRRAAIEQALRATGSSHAEAAITRIAQRLDAWSDGWQHARSAVCRHAQPSPSDASDDTIADLGRACLERGRVRLAAHLDALAEADADVLEHAVSATLALPDPSACADPQALRDRTPPPPAALRAAVAAVQEDLSRITAMVEAGRAILADAPSQTALDAAIALDWLPLRAEAWFLRGRVQAAAGQMEAAEKSLASAHIDAIASDRDRIAAEVAILLVRLVGADQSRFDAGDRWTRHAQVALARLSDPGSLPADLAIAEATLAMRAGRFDRAGERLDAARSQYEALGISDERLAAVRSSWGSLHLRRGRYTEAIEQFEAALAIRRDLYGDEHPKIASSLEQIGVARFYMGEYETAIERHREALALRERHFGTEHPQVAGALNNLGIAAVRLRRYDEALPAYRRALAIQERALDPDHPEIAGTLNNIGVVYQEQGQPDEAQQWLRRSLDVQMRRLGNEHPDLAAPLNNLGVVERMRGNPAAALELHDRALAILAPYGDEHVVVITSLLGRGQALFALGRFAEARAELEIAYESASAGAGMQVQKNEATVALARTLAALGDDPERCAHLIAEAERLFADSPSVVAEMQRLRATLPRR